MSNENNKKPSMGAVFLAVLFFIGIIYLFASTRETNDIGSLSNEVITDNKEETMTTENQKTTNPIVVIETGKGVIKFELRPEEAPKTVQNFIDLTEKGFYDGLTFHRVEPNFVIQGGDPKGNGTGGSDKNIPLEIKCKDGDIIEGETVACPVALQHTDGAVAMARAQDPNSASSQFYITNGPQSFLDGNYAVFGYVTEGMDVVRQVAIGDVMTKVYILK